MCKHCNWINSSDDIENDYRLHLRQINLSFWSVLQGIVSVLLCKALITYRSVCQHQHITDEVDCYHVRAACENEFEHITWGCIYLPLWPLQTLDSYIDQLPPIGWTRQSSTLVEMWNGFEVWELYEVKHSCRSKFWYDVEYPSVVPCAFCTTITNANNWRAKPGPNPSIQFLHSRPCLLSGAEKISFRSDIYYYNYGRAMYLWLLYCCSKHEDNYQMVWHYILVRQKYCCFMPCIYPKVGRAAVAFEL